VREGRLRGWPSPGLKAAWTASRRQWWRAVVCLSCVRSEDRAARVPGDQAVRPRDPPALTAVPGGCACIDIRGVGGKGGRLLLTSKGGGAGA